MEKTEQIRLLSCYHDRLFQLLGIPFSEIMDAADEGWTIEPHAALEILGAWYQKNKIDNDYQMAAFVELCAKYWRKELIEERKHLQRQNKSLACDHDIFDIFECPPQQSIKYDEVTIRNELLYCWPRLGQNAERIVFAAAAMEVLQSLSWNKLYFDIAANYGLERLEQAIVELGDSDLIRLRYFSAEDRFSDININLSLTAAELSHISLLNSHMETLLDDVVQKMRCSMQLLKESKLTESALIIGKYYFVPTARSVSDIMQALMSAKGQEEILYARPGENQNQVEECVNDCSISKEFPIIKSLREHYGIRICQGFISMFLFDSIFTMKDILQIYPEQIKAGVEIRF